MALSLTVNTPFGVLMQNAYARIDSITGTKKQLDFTLFYYVNLEAAREGKLPFQKSQYSFIPSVEDGAPNYHKQGYEYLKTLPEFAGAIDILED